MENFSGFQVDKLQSYFDADFDALQDADEDEIKFISQSHSGDLLIEKSEPIDGERYNLWRNLDCNGGGIEIEYCGAANGYRWETIYES
jgi:hypothetical protein